MTNIYTLTGLSDEQLKQNCRWFCQQGQPLKVDIFKVQKREFYRQKGNYPDVDLSLISLSAFYLAIAQVKQQVSSFSSKNRDDDLSGVAQTTRLRAKQHKNHKQRPKYQKLLNLQSVLLTLIDKEAYSYRDVASYIQRYHHFEVSHTLVGKVYNIIKGGDND